MKFSLTHVFYSATNNFLQKRQLFCFSMMLCQLAQQVENQISILPHQTYLVNFNGPQQPLALHEAYLEELNVSIIN